jgi:hypothetical protein
MQNGRAVNYYTPSLIGTGVEFHLGYGAWMRLLRASGFEVLDLLEIRAPDDLTELRGDGLVDPDWARKWPAEQICGSAR